jgi:hypothetical protein
MRKHLAIVLVALFTAILGVGGCGSDGESNRLRLQLSWIKNSEFTGEYFSDTNGY